MPRPIIPAFFDLNQDVAGPIPTELIQAWVESDGGLATHDALLKPYQRHGIIACSDSAGLSKLSQGKSLIEVMKLVNDPKEIIHAHGKAIGGQAMGVWAADNTQMFYDAATSSEAVVTHMIAAQRRIASCAVQVGIGLHKAQVYAIGGGLYGEEADEIEEFTEEESKAGEVIVSDTIHAELPEHLKLSEKRGDNHVLQHADFPAIAAMSKDVFYPAPFDRSFHNALRTLDINDINAVNALHTARVRELTIVLFRVFQKPADSLLNTLVNNVAANALMHNALRRYKCTIVKADGRLGIIACDSKVEALEAALSLRQAALDNGLSANVGVCSGEVLLFTLDRGGFDIAGNPVNIASKLAEDTPDRGVVFLEQSVAEHGIVHGITIPFELSRSGVTITGVRTA